MANLNRIILVGKLVSDPEAKFTVEGVPMTKFKLAVDRYHKEGTPQATDFIDIIAWRRLAEICGEYLKKESLILLEGRIAIRSFDDQAGTRKWVTEVIARNMQMLGGGGRGGLPAGQAGGSGMKTPEAIESLPDIPEEEDDLPF